MGCTQSKRTLESIRKGISIGCPLSPLLGALFLKPLDDAMEKLMAKSGVFYVRFMDDWVVLGPTRWKLRCAIQQVNACLNALKVHKHPDKTSIGRTENGFDFLGHHFQVVEEEDKMESRAKENTNNKKVILLLAIKSIQKMLDKIARLYEQGVEFNRIEQYIQRWKLCFSTSQYKFEQGVYVAWQTPQ